MASIVLDVDDAGVYLAAIYTPNNVEVFWHTLCSHAPKSITMPMCIINFFFNLIMRIGIVVDLIGAGTPISVCGNITCAKRLQHC